MFATHFQLSRCAKWLWESQRLLVQALNISGTKTRTKKSWRQPLQNTSHPLNPFFEALTGRSPGGWDGCRWHLRGRVGRSWFSETGNHVIHECAHWTDVQGCAVGVSQCSGCRNNVNDPLPRSGGYKSEGSLSIWLKKKIHRLTLISSIWEHREAWGMENAAKEKSARLLEGIATWKNLKIQVWFSKALWSRVQRPIRAERV